METPATLVFHGELDLVEIHTDAGAVTVLVRAVPESVRMAVTLLVDDGRLIERIPTVEAPHLSVAVSFRRKRIVIVRDGIVAGIEIAIVLVEFTLRDSLERLAAVVACS